MADANTNPVRKEKAKSLNQPHSVATQAQRSAAGQQVLRRFPDHEWLQGRRQSPRVARVAAHRVENDFARQAGSLP